MDRSTIGQADRIAWVATTSPNRSQHALTVGRGLSRVGAADRVATPQALLTGSGRPPQFSVGAWGAQFSPNPAGDIFGSPRGFAAVTPLRCMTPWWSSWSARQPVTRGQDA